jgi:cobaltochelatase CobT
MSNKEASLKEKLKQALSSTVRVISDDLKIDQKLDKNKSSKKFDFFEIDNLSGPRDFVRLRAEADSTAHKKKFSDDLVFRKNSPKHL